MSPAKSKRKLKGFTLVELTVVISVNLVLIGSSLAVLNQQSAINNEIRKRSFIPEQAPQINTVVSKMIKRADRFQIYKDVAAAQSANAATSLADCSAILLVYRDSIGGRVFGLIGVEEVGDQVNLNYYLNSGSGWGGAPSWKIASWGKSDTIKDNNDLPFDLSVENGVLRMKLTGPLDEEVTYASLSAY